MSTPVFVIAEAGVNHNGSIELALQLVDAAKEAGADAVKFQTFRTEKVMTRSVSMADYQKQNLRQEGSQFEMVKRLELSYENFAQLKAHCIKVGIQFLSTPDEEESLDFLVDELDLPWIKVGSGEVNNFPFLEQIGAKQRPVMLSTGMSTLGEVERAVNTLRESGCPELVVLHCTTNYPCPPEEVNLRAMETLRIALKVRVGYSDHTLGWEIPVAAVALGAEVIEKHFTLDHGMEGPDHLASLDPPQLREMVSAIRRIEQAMGDGVKRPNPSEQRTKKMVRRRLVASRDLEPGHRLQTEDLQLKRAESGIEPEHLQIVLGHTLLAPLVEDRPLTWAHLMNG